MPELGEIAVDASLVRFQRPDLCGQSWAVESVEDGLSGIIQLYLDAALVVDEGLELSDSTGLELCGLIPQDLDQVLRLCWAAERGTQSGGHPILEIIGTDGQSITFV